VSAKTLGVKKVLKLYYEPRNLKFELYITLSGVCLFLCKVLIHEIHPDIINAMFGDMNSGSAITVSSIFLLRASIR